MSPQKPADSEKKRLQQTGSIQPQGVLLALDSQFFIQYCSENVGELLQLPYAAVLGRNFNEFANAADIEQIRSLKGLGDWRSSVVLNLHMRRGNNWLNCNAAVSYDNHHWLVELELQVQAEDIPAQTRALNSQNLTWVTANRKCATVPVHGAPDIGTDQSLDMTCSAYRSLPLAHLEYLGNMGVAAALTISLTQNGRLWGMLTCHHTTPKNVTLRERELYEFIGRTISVKLPDLQRHEQQPVTSQTFLDQTSEAVVIAGADGRIQSVNRSFCEITGYTSQEAIGHNPSILQSGIHTAQRCPGPSHR